ncbi:MAG TPA: hypothetical protein VG247_04490 [Pseudonocardiaceae bacterium]|jgi:uncharacterized protein YukE|nr:hypothetical protein [Pseudonocardiaceae bacterium]
MGDGFAVNHAEVQTAGEQTGTKAAEAEGIKGKVAAANGKVPSQAWGLLGQMGPYEIYQAFYSSFSDHVNTMVSDLQTLSDNLKKTADQYKQNEDAINDKLKDVMKDLDGGAKPPETAGGSGGGKG